MGAHGRLVHPEEDGRCLLVYADVCREAICSFPTALKKGAPSPLV